MQDDSFKDSFKDALKDDSAKDLSAQSVFDPECPICGVALRPIGGLIWGCPKCGFRAERVAGTLIQIDSAERRPDRLTS